MILLRGISGFWDAKTKPPPLEDEKTFRQMCHLLARNNGGTVAEVDTDTTARSFYFAQICKYESSIFVLQNAHYPYAAFAQRDPFGGFTLTQQPKWLQLPESPVHVLSLDELNQDWHSLCKELGQEELEQISFWRPQTVGEIIFNTWD